MGNSQTTEYSFQDQFYILEDSFPTDTFYKLQSKQTEQLFIGRQIQTLSKDDTYQLECILKQLQINPSPFCIKLLHATKINQNAYCSNGCNFYLLFPWINTLGYGMEGGARYSIREVDLMIGRVCKALKYIYGINHEHGYVSPYSVMYPSFCLVDKWALKGTGGKGRDGRDGKDEKEGRVQKYAADLYAVGEIARSMMERVGNKKQSAVEGWRVGEKISVLMGERIMERFDIYAVLDMKDQHRVKDIHHEYYNNDSNKPVMKQIQAHLMPIITQNNFVQPTKVNTNFQQSQVLKQKVAYQPQPQNAPSIFTAPNFVAHKTLNSQPSHMYNKANTIYDRSANTNMNKILKANINSELNGAINEEKGYKVVENAQILIPHVINKTNGQLKYQPNQLIHQNVRSSSFDTPTLTQFTLPKTYNTLPQHPISLAPPTLPYTSAFGVLPKQTQADSTLDDQKSIKFMKDLDKIGQVKVGQNYYDESNLFTPTDFYQKLRQQSTTINTISSYLFNPNSIQPTINHVSITNVPISIPTTNSDTVNAHSLSLSPKQTTEHININPSEQTINLQVNSSPSPHSPPTPLKEPLLKQQLSQTQMETEQREEERVPIYERIPPVTVIPELSQQSGGEEEDREFVVQQYQNGSRYEGYKFNGMRDGEGKFTYQQGSYYTGLWKKNNMHGFGRLYYPNQKLAYEGNWFVDQFHGNGKVYNDEPVEIQGYFDYTNFDQMGEKWLSYEGTLVCDSKEGYGKLILSNGEYYAGNFEGDRVSGEGVFVSKDKSIKGIWKDSRLVKIL